MDRTDSLDRLTYRGTFGYLQLVPWSSLRTSRIPLSRQLTRVPGPCPSPNSRSRSHHMIRKTSLTCSAALLLAAAACSSSTDVSTSLSASAATQLAADMDNSSSLAAAGVSFATGTNTFSVTKQCPQGGHIALAGTVVATGDQTTQSFVVDATANRTDTGCAFDTDDGVVTLNGSIDYTAHVNIVNGLLSGLQTQTHKGSFMGAPGRVGQLRRRPELFVESCHHHRNGDGHVLRQQRQRDGDSIRPSETWIRSPATLPGSFSSRTEIRYSKDTLRSPR